MITSSIAIVGEPFKDYVSDQITKRQEIQGSGLTQGTSKTPQQLQYLNGSNAWLKIASSVEIIGDEGKQKLLEIFPESDADFLLGSELAKRFTLFNGTTTYNIPNQRQGILTENRQINSSVYGTAGIDFGLQAMPGIESFTVSNANRGSIRQGEIVLRANSEQQFNILELLYIRLGYTMLVEWGNGMYFDNNGDFQKMGPTLIDDDTWFDQNGTTHLDFFKKIEDKRKEYNGNYDAFFCKVTNFNWTFTTEGYYQITLSLISLGDIVESFKVNTLYNDTLILKKTEENTEISEINKSAIHNFLYCLRQEKDLQNPQTLEVNKDKRESDIVTPVSLDTKKYKQNFKGVTADQLYFIRFGRFLEWFENNITDHNKNGNSEAFPVIEITISDENYMQIFPGLVSIDPSKCYIENNLVKSNDNLFIGRSISVASALQYFKPLAVEKNPNVGRIMDIYLNFNFITKTLDNLENEKGNVDYFTFFDKICEGINSCFAGYINLRPIISDDNIVEFIDDNLPNRLGKDGLPIPGEEVSPTLQLYGINQSDNTSNFVKNFEFQTQITNDLATTISIGATANNESTNQLSSFFKSLNQGLKDRYQQERYDGNPDKKEEQKLACADKTEKTTSLAKIVWTEIKTVMYDIVSGVGNIANDIIRQEELNKISNSQTRYVDYLEKMFGSKNTNELFRYFQLKNSDIEEGRILLDTFIKSFENNVNRATGNESSSSMLGFIPIETSIDIDGISGMKIYNQLKIDTKFLPRNYPNIIDFIIIGINHTIQNNQWTTRLTALSKPSKNITQTKIVQSEESTKQEPGNPNIEDVLDPLIQFYPPNNRPVVDLNIRDDGKAGDGRFGTFRSKTGKHRGLDLDTRVGQNVFAPITGRIEYSKSFVKSKLDGFKIYGSGDYQDIIVYVFYARLKSNIQTGTQVQIGTPVANAQDLTKPSGDYSARVSDHVHFAIYDSKKERYIDPESVNYLSPR